MVDDIITTGVDSLINLLKTVDKISLFDVSKKLKVPINTLQSWVDFLVEEKIIGLEYKFTKPYIYINKTIESKNKGLPTINDIKTEYMKLAKDKKIPSAQIDSLWNAHVREELIYIENYFTEQAIKRGFSKEKIHSLWTVYVNQLMNRLSKI